MVAQKKIMKQKLTDYTITMASGTKFGGKYRNEEHAREANGFYGEVVSIERRSLFSPEEKEEMDRDKAYHRAY
jgi:hypothetical protein